jgi:hypothetical protein
MGKILIASAAGAFLIPAQGKRFRKMPCAVGCRAVARLPLRSPGQPDDYRGGRSDPPQLPLSGSYRRVATAGTGCFMKLKSVKHLSGKNNRREQGQSGSVVRRRARETETDTRWLCERGVCCWLGLASPGLNGDGCMASPKKADFPDTKPCPRWAGFVKTCSS